MEKSLLAEFITKNIQSRREAKKAFTLDSPYIYKTCLRPDSPFSFRSVIATLSDRERFIHQQRMYQLSGSMGGQGILRFKPADGSF